MKPAGNAHVQHTGDSAGIHEQVQVLQTTNRPADHDDVATIKFESTSSRFSNAEAINDEIAKAINAAIVVRRIPPPESWPTPGRPELRGRFSETPGAASSSTGLTLGDGSSPDRTPMLGRYFAEETPMAKLPRYTQPKKTG